MSDEVTMVLIFGTGFWLGAVLAGFFFFHIGLKQIKKLSERIEGDSND